jgi:hypothetical protein
MTETECETNCVRILNWAPTKKGKPFNTNVVENILDWVRQNDHATERQLEVTQNIIDKFKIP